MHTPLFVCRRSAWRAGIGGRLGAVTLLLLCVSVGPAAASNLLVPVDPETEDVWSITGFVGQWDDSRFGEILSFRGGDFKSAYIGGLALNRRLATSFDERVQWEAEGSVYRHWGRQHLWEGNLAIVGRWTQFPWDQYVNTSLAAGQGVSLASRPPRPVEGDDTRQFLNHLLVELEFAPPGDGPVSFVTRLHHRSGAFGLYGARAGSNYINLGIRYRF